VDRLLSLLLRLRYKQVVTLKRTYVIVITFWVVHAAFSAVFILVFLYNLMLCHHSYITVSSDLNLLLHKNFPQSPSSSKSNTRPCSTTEPSKSTEHSAIQKAVSTAIWLQLTLVACYLPNGIVMATIVKSGLSTASFYAWNYVLTLVFLNSSLNPNS